MVGSYGKIVALQDSGVSSSVSGPRMLAPRVSGHPRPCHPNEGIREGTGYDPIAVDCIENFLRGKENQEVNDSGGPGFTGAQGKDGQIRVAREKNLFFVR